MVAALTLNTIRHEGPGAVPLIVAHGLFGSARNWNAVAKRLAEDRPVIAVDMRNHGASPWSDDHSYQAQAADLAAAIEAEGEQADVLGHSMGGKAAMVLALTAPDRVRRLIVADIAPRAYAHSQAPVVEALRGVDLTRVTRRSDADAQLADALPDKMLRAFLLQSLEVGPDGARWRLNLDALADQMPRIMGFPQVSGQFDGPVDVLRGGASDYVDAAGEDALRALLPGARVQTMAGRGHWLHAEDPRGFESALRGVLG